MLAEDRLLDIEAIAAALIERLVPRELDGETLRVVLYWADGSNLRVAEQWAGDRLVRYSVQGVGWTVEALNDTASRDPAYVSSEFWIVFCFRTA